MSYINRNDIAIHKDRNDIAVFVAKLYLICLTFKMIAPFAFLESIIGSAALSFDLIPHVLGVLIILFENGGQLSLEDDEEGKLVSYFAKMVVWFTISSGIMAIIIQSTYGNLGNENAFRGILGMILYWAQYAFILYYNYHIFKLLTLTELENTLKVGIIILMVIGYMQMIVMLSGGLFGNIYDKLDFLDILNDSNKLPKLSLTGMEGAYGGYIMGTMVFPFLYALNLSGKSKGSLLIYIILWIPLVYMTYSSAAYILFAVTTVSYMFYYAKTRGFTGTIITVFGILILLGIVVLVFGNDILNILPAEVSSNVRYLLFEKIQDSENGSTAMRSVPLNYNWGAFTEYPIIGVGNGLQGYFLEKYFPEAMRTAKGIDASYWLQRWTSGISNGALFWPSILSGYGVVGVILVFIYIVKSELLLRMKKYELGTMYYMYRLSLAGIIVAGFATDFVAKYYIWFAISLPLIPVIHHEENDKALNRNSSGCKYIRE